MLQAFDREGSSTPGIVAVGGLLLLPRFQRRRV